MVSSDPPPEETSLHSVAFAPLFRSQPRLEWRDAAGSHVVTVDGRMLVGSAPANAIVVQGPTVSRLHAELEARDDGLWIRDLGSRNGTFVNEVQVAGARVPHGARIRLGAMELSADYNAASKRPVELWSSKSFGKLVGASAPMRELFAKLSRVAPVAASVLVHGETGTGKELVARAIHDASPRANKPFIVVDCAALPENLLDAELFGHTKGAFTGAMASRPGAIEAADGGTVFLDEIGELPVSMQPKLLRVLESRVIRRLGETSHRDVDVRFISATHRDLLTMVNAGEFREDLYFRLSVIPVTVPPLRERKEDIALLITHFLEQLSNAATATPELIRALENRPWRGNVRELRNFAERAGALGAAEALALIAPPVEATSNPRLQAAPVARSSDVDESSHAGSAAEPAMFEQTYKDFREAWIDTGEKEYVKRLLLRNDRNVAAAAREAEVDRTYIYRLIRKHML